MMCSENIKRGKVMMRKMLLVACVSLSSVGAIWAEESVSRVGGSAAESVGLEKKAKEKVQRAVARKCALSSRVTALKNLVWGAGTFGQNYIRRLLVIFGPVVTYYLLKGENSGGGSGAQSGQKANGGQQNVSGGTSSDAHTSGDVLADALRACEEYEKTFKEHIAQEAERGRHKKEAVVKLREEMLQKVEGAEQKLNEMKDRYSRYKKILTREMALYGFACEHMRAERSMRGPGVAMPTVRDRCATGFQCVDEVMNTLRSKFGHLQKREVYAAAYACEQERIKMWQQDPVSFAQERDLLKELLGSAQRDQKVDREAVDKKYQIMRLDLGKRVEKELLRYGSSGASAHNLGAHSRLLSKARMHAYDVEYEKQREITQKAMREGLDVRADAIRRIGMLAVAEEAIVDDKSQWERELKCLQGRSCQE